MKRFAFFLFFSIFIWAPGAAAEQSGTVRGVVTLQANGLPLHSATSVVVQLGRSAETEDEGRYEIRDIPPGRYDVVAHLHALTDEKRTVEVTAGAAVEANFALRLSTLHESVTVTSSGRAQTGLERFQSVAALDAVELVENGRGSLGEVLEGEPGVAKRSFGPGTSRPVIRGFDGDRVLIMNDGVPTGTISSQSGDHGETFSTLNLERLEVVKGPATLLYGSNAVGGVVNAITPRFELHEQVHQGPSGYFTALGSSANGQGGTAGGLEYGVGNWLLWGDGAAQRTGDYDTPEGTVFNSFARTYNGSGGFGRFTKKGFFTISAGRDTSRYGVPPLEDEAVHLALRRTSARFSGGFRNLDSPVQGFRFTGDYGKYHHEELSEQEVPNTIFENNIFAYRGVFEQRKQGPLTGSFGFSGLHRDYTTSGEEAIAPPVKLNNFSAFTIQDLGF